VSLRFLADADLNQAIVIGMLGREPALDFLTATEAGLEGHGSVHFFDRLRSGRRNSGVFLVRQRASVGQVVEAILLVWSASAPGEWAGQMHYLPSLARHDFHN
jgi:hypothetical protein